MLAMMVACAAPFAYGQSDDYNKYDIFVGYSHNRVDIGVGDDDPDFDDFIDEREGFHGLEFSAKGALSRYVGVKGDYAYHRKSFNFQGNQNFTVDANLHTLVGGIEVKDNARETKVKPFAHLMAGLAHARVDIDDVDFEGESDTGFAGVIGGGLDFRVNDRVDIRAIQFDWNPAWADGSSSHNFRIGFGIVFR